MNTSTQRLLKRYTKDIMSKDNVVGIGIAYDEDDNDVLVVNVTNKLPLTSLHRNDVVPRTIEGCRSRVQEVGILRAQRTSRIRPFPAGVSIGHPDVTAGTLGLWVRDNATGRIVGLSNNHVIANSNGALIGDPILQPGAFDGGILSDTVGSLERFVPIDFGGNDGGGGLPDLPPGCSIPFGSFIIKMFATKKEQPIQNEPNLVDAAIFMPTDDDEVLLQVYENEIPMPTSLGEASVNMELQKSGRTTGYTTGTVQQVGVTVDVQYGDGQVARLEDQILTTAMSEGGDSGSAVMDFNNNLVGLLFAGSAQVTVLNRIQNVFDLLNISLV